MTLEEFRAKWGTATASLLLERVAALSGLRTESVAVLRELSVDLENLLKVESSTPLRPNVKRAVQESHQRAQEAEAMQNAEQQINTYLKRHEAYETAVAARHVRYLDSFNEDDKPGEPESRMGGDRS